MNGIIRKNTKSPTDYLPSASEKVWWICKDTPCGCHNWLTSINSRNRGRGCPFCINKSLCKHNSLQGMFPIIAQEWDYKKNKLTPLDYSPFSNVKVFWICKNGSCDCHCWEMSISSRTRKNRRCPYCTGRYCCLHNNLTITHPELCKEWDYTNNLSSPGEYKANSTDTVSWICKNDPCGCHQWSCTIVDRTRFDTDCPYCSKSKCCFHSSLLAGKFYYLVEEWDYDKNKLGPECYSTFSSEQIWWICFQNSTHRWQMSILYRTSQNIGCPYCRTHYSKKQIEWIKILEYKYNIKIQHAQTPEGEYQIYENKRVKYRLDGYCKIDNTQFAFEFDGCYWHGCEYCFHQDDVNAFSNKTFGELNLNTQIKHEYLRNHGYTLISIRECEYNVNKCIEYDELDNIINHVSYSD